MPGLNFMISICSKIFLLLLYIFILKIFTENIRKCHDFKIKTVNISGVKEETRLNDNWHFFIKSVKNVKD